MKQEVLWAGNRESLFKAFFHKDSIILWSLTNLRRVRQQYVERMQNPAYSHIEFIRLRSRRQVREFLASLQPESFRQINLGIVLGPVLLISLAVTHGPAKEPNRLE